MKDADFELIMAYADGETGPEDTARAEALLAGQPQARAALARLRAADQQIKTSLDAVLDEPVPERLTRATIEPKPSRGRVLRFPMSLTSSRWALAASLVLALGAAFFWLGTPEFSTRAMQTFVHQTLEQTPSGERRIHSGKNWQLMPLASYDTADGRLCREYAGRTESYTLSGLACRSTGGDWQILVSQSQKPTEAYLPASGPTADIADLLQELEAGEPLSPEEEAARLKRSPK